MPSADRPHLDRARRVKGGRHPDPASSRRPSRTSGVVLPEWLEGRLLMAFSANVNFQPATAPVPAGYVADSGKAYGARGNGLAYGWNLANNNAMDRNAARSPDQRYDTFNYLQAPNAGTVWELGVPSGSYSVKVVAGDPNVFGTQNISVENALTVNARTSSTSYWATGTKTVNVTDGRLTIRAAAGASSAKINFVEVRQLTVSPPPASPPPAVPPPPPPPTSPPPPPPAGSIVADLMNSTTDARIATLTDGYVIDMGQVGTKLNIRATPAGPAGSIVFKLDGAIARTETYAPYGIGGDAGGSDFLDWTPPVGAHTVQILQYSGAGGTGAVVASNTFGFTAVAPGSPPTVPPTVPPPPTSPPPPPPPGPVGGPLVELMDATTHAPIKSLADGDTIDMNVVGTRLNLRATPGGPASRLSFRLDGLLVRTDGTAPYSVDGDGVDDYLDWAPPTGPFTLQVEHYDWSAGGEVLVGTTTLGLTGVGPASPPTSPPPVPPPPPPPTTVPPPPPTVPFPTGLNWSTAASSPVPRAEAVGAVVNGKLYVMGGFDGTRIPGTVDGWTAIARCDVYDPATNRWTRIADMPDPFTHATGTVVGTDIWFVGGYDGAHPGPGTTQVWVYSTTANRWTRGPDLPQPRGAGGAVLLGNTIYYTAGMERTRTSNARETWALDLSNQGAGWVAKAPIPTGRNHVGVVAHDGKLWAVGGQNGQEEYTVGLTAVEYYDPATDRWTAARSLPVARSHLTASIVSYKGRIVFTGGDPAHDQPKREVYAYDPATNNWSVLGYLPAARSTTVTGVLPDGRIIVATGNGPGATTNVWIATPK